MSTVCTKKEQYTEYFYKSMNSFSLSDFESSPTKILEKRFANLFVKLYIVPPRPLEATRCIGRVFGGQIWNKRHRKPRDAI